MTAQDMISLFNPPPFGESKESALQEALRSAPDLWGRLRNVDMDKEALMLQVPAHPAAHTASSDQKQRSQTNQQAILGTKPVKMACLAAATRLSEWRPAMCTWMHSQPVVAVNSFLPHGHTAGTDEQHCTAA